MFSFLSSTSVDSGGLGYIAGVLSSNEVSPRECAAASSSLSSIEFPSRLELEAHLVTLCQCCVIQTSPQIRSQILSFLNEVFTLPSTPQDNISLEELQEDVQFAVDIVVNASSFPLLELLSVPDLEPGNLFSLIGVLKALFAECSVPSTLQKAFLSIPMSVHSLCLLLQNASEPIRNEALLLLLPLSDNDISIQKMLVFEGALPLLAQIAQDELEFQSVISHDALKLIQSLLTGVPLTELSSLN